MVFHIPITAEYFYCYLERAFPTNNEGVKLFLLYGEIRFYMKEFESAYTVQNETQLEEDEDNSTIYQKRAMIASDILQNFLSPDSELYVLVDDHIL